MRQANTTFVNLRAALDDVDPLVDASKPVAIRLRPFFSEFRGAAARRACRRSATSTTWSCVPAPPTTSSTSTACSPRSPRPRSARARPTCAENPRDPEDLQSAADDDFTQGAFGEQICALKDGLPAVAFLRAYTPELVGWFDDFGHSGTIDANGGIGRISTTLQRLHDPVYSR